jgi:hypothetical protein
MEIVYSASSPNIVFNSKMMDLTIKVWDIMESSISNYFIKISLSFNILNYQSLNVGLGVMTAL